MTLAELMTMALTMGAQSLAFTGEEAAKTLVGEAVKGAYKNLKSKVASWAPTDVEQLHSNPDSKGRQLIVTEAIANRSPEEQGEGATLAQSLLDALHQASTESCGPIGIDIGRLEAARIKLGEITVSSGTGLRAQEIVTSGEFETGPIRVGDKSGK